MLPGTIVLIGAALVLTAGCAHGQAGGGASRAADAHGHAAGSQVQAPPAAAAAAGGPAAGRCSASALAVGVGRAGVAAGNVYQPVSLTNTSGASCWLYGFPGLLMLDAGGRPMPTRVVRVDGPTFPGISPVPQRVVLAPGATAPFYLHFGDVPTGSESTCPQSETLLVTPPDDTRQLRVAERIAPCQGGTIDVSPVLAPGTHGDIAS
ncbi:MAG TPA: DUF4232 domain-containing protein [Candidatus Dormibacteraeota bacterium]